jgi:hypothetical protein
MIKLPYKPLSLLIGVLSGYWPGRGSPVLSACLA